MSTEELLIWVNEHDEEIGYGSKLETHIQGILHRAFSIFIFDCQSGKMLLQRRAFSKYHSGGLWSNACCSHPHKGEPLINALNSRIYTELGVTVNLRVVDGKKGNTDSDDNDVFFNCGSFLYSAQFDGLSENELDHVFLYCLRNNSEQSKSSVSILDNIKLNPNEIEETMWISIKELRLWIDKHPNEFTAWFRPAFNLVLNVLDDSGLY